MEYLGVLYTEAMRRRPHTGEDDENISDMVKKFLLKEGYSVDSCFNGDEALLKFYEKNYNLLILDIMLPGINGQALLKSFVKMMMRLF